MNLIIFLFLSTQFVEAENSVKSKAIDIVIRKSDIYFNNSKLSNSGTIEELNKLIGVNTRSKSTSLAWDAVGIKVIGENNFVGELQIYLKKRSPFEKPKTNSLGRYMVDMRPIRDFSGKLTIDGVEITRDTTILELNKTLKGAEFSKDALYKTYRRYYVPKPKNKNLSCTIYVSLSDTNKVYQVSRECIDWRKYSDNPTIKSKKNDTARKAKKINHLKNTSTLSQIDAYQKKYVLNDKQLNEFVKRIEARRQTKLMEKAVLIEKKIRSGEITQKQADRLVMQLLFPGLTTEKITEQNKAQDAINSNKDGLSKKNQAALKMGAGLMMLQDILGGDSLSEKDLQSIAKQVKKDIAND